MKTIPQELETFRKEVGTSLDGMEGKRAEIQEKTSSLMTASSSASNGVSTYYNSSNKNTVLKKFTYINEVYQKINTSVGSDLKNMLTKAKEIVEKVEKLDELIKDIEVQEGIISSEKEEDDASKQRVSNARSALSKDNTDFDTIANEAIVALNALKSMDAELQFVTDFTAKDYTDMLTQLAGGTFKRDSYKASNGEIVNYYIFIPDYSGEEVEGLPVHIYLHGSGESGGEGTLTCGLPKMINDKTIVPEGIVICPQAADMKTYYRKSYQDALIELTNKIIEKNNADPDKVSLSGHSMGAIVGYTMVSRYPDYFSAFVPISGYCNPQGSSLANIKVWAFHGKTDNRISIAEGKEGVDRVNAAGGEAELESLDMGHTNIQNYVFVHEFKNNNGDTMNPLVWAFRQSKNA